MFCSNKSCTIGGHVRHSALMCLLFCSGSFYSLVGALEARRIGMLLELLAFVFGGDG